MTHVKASEVIFTDITLEKMMRYSNEELKHCVLTVKEWDAYSDELRFVKEIIEECADDPDIAEYIARRKELGALFVKHSHATTILQQRRPSLSEWEMEMRAAHGIR